MTVHRSRGTPRLMLAVCALIALCITVLAWQTPLEDVQLTQAGGTRVHVYHNPPLVAFSDESVELQYDVVCASHEPSYKCSPSGYVYVKPEKAAAVWERFPLMQGGSERHYRLYAEVPPRLVVPPSFVYYAQITAGGQTVYHPRGGMQTPQRVYVVSATVNLPLTGPAPFHEPDAVIVDARWGDGPDELGLNSGPEIDPAGPSSFDVTGDGSVVVMDTYNGRLQFTSPGGEVQNVPVDVLRGLPDVAADPDGTIHILESSSQDGDTPRVKTFDRNGTPVRTARTAEHIVSKIRVGASGPMVYQYPTAAWMPLYDSVGNQLTKLTQTMRSGDGIGDASGRSVVVKATPDEVRVAHVDGQKALRVWTLTKPDGPEDLSFGEVQLVEQRGSEVVVVVALWNETHSAFRVVHLAADRIRAEFTVEAGLWAETASVSRFRLGPDLDLYQIRSNEAGAQVVRFGLGGDK